MANDMEKEREWAQHMPSEGENRQNAEQQRTREGVEEKVRSPQYQQAAGAAPGQADPQAAEENREFVEDTAMQYDKAEERFAKGDK
ncbi:MAG TPA: hypothetical protein VK009_21895 [Chloroflexota bacterium]|nr:hypothetical protein [Chloroflexota bacterium]